MDGLLLFLSAEEKAEEPTNPFIGFMHLQLDTRRFCWGMGLSPLFFHKFINLILF